MLGPRRRDVRQKRFLAAGAAALLAACMPASVLRTARPLPPKYLGVSANAISGRYGSDAPPLHNLSVGLRLGLLERLDVGAAVNMIGFSTDARIGLYESPRFAAALGPAATVGVQTWTEGFLFFSRTRSREGKWRAFDLPLLLELGDPIDGIGFLVAPLFGMRWYEGTSILPRASEDGRSTENIEWLQLRTVGLASGLALRSVVQFQSLGLGMGIVIRQGTTRVVPYVIPFHTTGFANGALGAGTGYVAGLAIEGSAPLGRKRSPEEGHGRVR